MGLGFSLRIFLPDGSPDGLRIVTRSNWTGRAVICPRAMYAEASIRPEFQATGVYILAGPTLEDGISGQVYVGEGDRLDSRIRDHAKNKDWWEHVVVFTTADRTLNKAGIRYLEGRLVEIARRAGRAIVENSTIPAPPVPNESDVADLEGFLEEVLTILPLLGIRAFDRIPSSRTSKGSQREGLESAGEIPGPSKSSAVQYRFTLGGADADGFPVPEGFVVRKGSRGLAADKLSASGSTAARRMRLIQEQRLTVDPVDKTKLILQQDMTFPSPSTAAGTLYGGNVNGREMWRTVDGRSLAVVEQAELDAVRPPQGHLPDVDLDAPPPVPVPITK